MEAVSKIEEGARKLKKLLGNLNNKSRKRKHGVPGAPKRPMSAYLFFMKEMRANKEANGDMKSTEIVKHYAAQWGNMNEEQKAPYTTMAETAKVTYQAQKNDFEAKQNNSEADQHALQPNVQSDEHQTTDISSDTAPPPVQDASQSLVDSHAEPAAKKHKTAEGTGNELESPAADSGSGADGAC